MITYISKGFAMKKVNYMDINAYDMSMADMCIRSRYDFV